MSKSRFIALRLLSVVIVALLAVTTFAVKPSIDVAAETIYIGPLGYPCPKDDD